MSFEVDGYTIINNVLTNQEVTQYRNILDSYLQHNISYRDKSAKILPGFAGRTPELKELNTLHQSDKILSHLNSIFNNQKFIFLDHSDLHQNKTTGWHRDTKDYDRGGGNSTWDKEYCIIKACFLLQDHIDNQHGLWFQPATHKKNIQNKEVYAKTKATDLIIFDQRILHRGQVRPPSYLQSFGQNRYLITYAYGLDNKHSKYHSDGAKARQEKQRSMLK